MARYSWWAELDHLASSDQLLALARHFLDEWTPQEIAMLPPGAWPAHPHTVDELVATALQLERLQSAYAPAGVPRMVRELLVFFTQLSIRALQLQLPAVL